MIAQLFKFSGGVHPPEHKVESAQSPIACVPMPARLVLPLRQHVGAMSKPLVKVGERVLKGQLLSAPDGNISAAVHAPTSGTVVAIDARMIPHVSGLPDMCITLESDGKDEWAPHQAVPFLERDPQEVVAALRQAGVVGLGGATFPSHVKLRSDAAHPVHTLIINGAECEPYITCDDRLMRERADQIAGGIRIMQHLLGARQCLVGVEDNKPEALAAMRAACANAGIEVLTVPTLYPGGGAKQLIKVLTGKEVPSGKLPPEIGVQCFNVATAYTVYRYITQGEPVLSRIVTVTGAVARPGNYEAPLGMSIKELIAFAGGASQDDFGIVMGGPMMGFNLPSMEAPVVKAANCLIVTTPGMFPARSPALPCIRCARCADACPVVLQPQELYWFAKSDNFEKARDYNLFDCIECGCCSYVCPSNIPLVQYYRYAKSEIIAADRAREAAGLARERNDFRLARIEREKQERAAKHAQKAAGAKAETAAGGADDAKKAAIAAALARAQEQKAAVQPQNTDNLSAATQAEIAAIEARRAGAEAKEENT